MQIQPQKGISSHGSERPSPKILQAINAEGAAEKCVPSSLTGTKLVRENHGNRMEVPLTGTH